MKKSQGIALLILFLFFLGGYILYNKTHKWTLMVCQSLLSNGIECMDHAVLIPGFNSSLDCMNEGMSKFSVMGFECGRNCKKWKVPGFSDGQICSEICNLSGCSK